MSVSHVTEQGVKVRYLHSDVDTLERIEIIRNYGEHRDPRLWERIREGMDIILPISELALLNDKIDNEIMPD